MNRQDLVEDAKLCVQRVARSDFLRDSATEAEREALAGAEPPITEPLVQDYAAWRRSVLYLAAVMLGLLALLQLWGYRSVEDGLVEGELEVLRAQREQQEQLMESTGMRSRFNEFGFPVPTQQNLRPIDEEAVREAVRKNLGEDNIAALDSISILSLLSVLAAASLVISSARSWRQVVRSRRLARWGVYALVGTPLVIALIPWNDWFLEFPEAAQQQEAGVRLMVAITIFMLLTPKVFSLFPGLIRAAVALKSMLHESVTPGNVAVLFAPVYALVLVIAFTLINQLQGSITLLVGILLLAVGPLTYVWKAKDFLRSHGAEEAHTHVKQIRATGAVCNIGGALFLGVFVAGLEDVSLADKLEFLVAALSGLFLMLVVGADLVATLVIKEFEQAEALLASGNKPALQAKVEALDAAGFGQLSDRPVFTTPSPPAPSATRDPAE